MRSSVTRGGHLGSCQGFAIGARGRNLPSRQQQVFAISLAVSEQPSFGDGGYVNENRRRPAGRRNGAVCEALNVRTRRSSLSVEHYCRRCGCLGGRWTMARLFRRSRSFTRERLFCGPYHDRDRTNGPAIPLDRRSKPTALGRIDIQRNQIIAAARWMKPMKWMVRRS